MRARQQFAAAFVVGTVQRHREARTHCSRAHAFDRANGAHRRNHLSLAADLRQIPDPRDRAEDRVEVVARLAHPHIDHAIGAQPAARVHHLFHHLVDVEVAFDAEQPAGAEATTHRAAHLRRDADRPGRHRHGLDALAVVQPDPEAERPVLAANFFDDARPQTRLEEHRQASQFVGGERQTLLVEVLLLRRAAGGHEAAGQCSLALRQDATETVEARCGRVHREDLASPRGMRNSRALR